MTIAAASFMIQGSGLEMFGFERTIADTYIQQSVLGIFGLLTMGFVYRCDEQWAPSFTLPINAWSGLSMITTSTTWTGLSMITLSTTWTT